MNLYELINLTQPGLIGLLVILAGMIKIPKIELNFWNWVGRTIGRSINRESMTQIDEFSKSIKSQVDDIYQEIEGIKKVNELERVRQARQRILRFNDELLFGQRHSKEHFDEILSDIDTYEEYCRTHKDYENNRAVLAIGTIREVYKDCLKTHDFLTHNKNH